MSPPHHASRRMFAICETRSTIDPSVRSGSFARSGASDTERRTAAVASYCADSIAGLGIARRREVEIAMKTRQRGMPTTPARMTRTKELEELPPPQYPPPPPEQPPPQP